MQSNIVIRLYIVRINLYTNIIQVDSNALSDNLDDENIFADFFEITKKVSLVSLIFDLVIKCI